MKLFIVCNNCGTRISGLLDNQIVLDFIGKIEKELLSKGQYGIDDAGIQFGEIAAVLKELRK